MQAITAGLEAILKDKFQAGASGFRGRVEVDVLTPGTLFSRYYGCPFVFGDTAPGGNGANSYWVGNTPYEQRDNVFLLGSVAWSGGREAFTSDADLPYLTSGFLDAYSGLRGDGTLTISTVEIVDGDPVTVTPAASSADTIIWWGTWEHFAQSMTLTVDGALIGTFYPENELGVAWNATGSGGAAELQYLVDYHASANMNADAAGGADEIRFNLGQLVTGTVWAMAITTAGIYGGPRYKQVQAFNYEHPPSTWLPMDPLASGTTAPKRISIDKSLRMTADQATIEFANEDLPLGWGPDSLFVTNSRCRIYQWYGDDTDNAVLTFTGIIDAVTDNRDVLTTSITCRDMMALLLDQTFGATAPQGADEDGAVRTAANGVYLNMEVAAIIGDILDRAGWPTADRDITATSYVLDEYIIPDGTSWAEAIIGEAVLTGLVGFNAWADEAGVFHFAPSTTTLSLTDPQTPAYTYASGVDIVSLQEGTDQYDLRTRVKVRGPLTTQTLTDVWREVWRTGKFAHPVGLWYDPAETTVLRVLDRGTKRLYKMRQSDRVVLSSVYLGGVIKYPLGLSGDPSDATIYWVLNGPWLWGSGANSSIKKVRKADNFVLATYTLDTDHWSAVKVSGAYIYVTNLSDEHVYRRSKATGAAVDDFRHTYQTVAQSNPSGIMIDGTTISVFWSNGGTTARFLQCDESAPGTVTNVVKTAGTSLHGGEMDTDTSTECWGDDDGAGLVAKFTLVEAVDQTDEVYAEVVDTDLEDELGALAQMESRTHDSHPGDAAHPYEVRRFTLDLEVITSPAQATDTAMRQLDGLSQRRRVLDVGIIGNPALQKSDIVRIEDPVTGISSGWSIDTYRTEMAADSTYLGTLALLPFNLPEELDDGGTPPTDDPPVVDDWAEGYWPMLALTSDTRTP